MNSRFVELSECGRLVGESHPACRYSDREIELVHQLYEEGMRRSVIARKMEMPRSTVYSILNGSRRAVPSIWKKVRVHEKKD